MVLAELCCGITFSLEHFGQGRIVFLNPAGRAGYTDRRHSGPDRQLPHEECGASRSAARLTVVIGRKDAFLCYPIDVWRPSHHAIAIGTDIPHSDVVTKDDQDVRPPSAWLLLRLRLLDRSGRSDRGSRRKRCAGEKKIAPADSTTLRIGFVADIAAAH